MNDAVQPREEDGRPQRSDQGSEGRHRSAGRSTRWAHTERSQRAPARFPSAGRLTVGTTPWPVRRRAGAGLFDHLVRVAVELQERRVGRPGYERGDPDRARWHAILGLGAADARGGEPAVGAEQSSDGCGHAAGGGLAHHRGVTDAEKGPFDVPWKATSPPRNQSGGVREGERRGWRGARRSMISGDGERPAPGGQPNRRGRSPPPVDVDGSSVGGVRWRWRRRGRRSWRRAWRGRCRPG